MKGETPLSRKATDVDASTLGNLRHAIVHDSPRTKGWQKHSFSDIMQSFRGYVIAAYARGLKGCTKQRFSSKTLSTSEYATQIN